MGHLNVQKPKRWMKVTALSNHTVFRSTAIIALATIFDVNVKHKPFEKRPDIAIKFVLYQCIAGFCCALERSVVLASKHEIPAF